MSEMKIAAELTWTDKRESMLMVFGLVQCHVYALLNADKRGAIQDDAQAELELSSLKKIIFSYLGLSRGIDPNVRETAKVLIETCRNAEARAQIWTKIKPTKNYATKYASVAIADALAEVPYSIGCLVTHGFLDLKLIEAQKPVPMVKFTHKFSPKVYREFFTNGIALCLMTRRNFVSREYLTTLLDDLSKGAQYENDYCALEIVAESLRQCFDQNHGLVRLPDVDPWSPMFPKVVEEAMMHELYTARLSANGFFTTIGDVATMLFMQKYTAENVLREKEVL